MKWKPVRVDSVVGGQLAQDSVMIFANNQAKRSSLSLCAWKYRKELELSKPTLSVPLRHNPVYVRVVKLVATADSKTAQGKVMSVRRQPRPPYTAFPKINAKILQDGYIRFWTGVGTQV